MQKTLRPLTYNRKDKPTFRKDGPVTQEQSPVILSANSFGSSWTLGGKTQNIHLQWLCKFNTENAEIQGPFHRS